MANLNKVFLMGNLTADPELRFTPAGAAVANFTVASTPRVYDRNHSQWNDGDKAQSQYDTLAEAMTGKEMGSGNVKVSGKTTGAYSAKADPDDDTKAVAVWRNDTVVFYATGAKNDIQRFYQQFPL